MQPYRQQPTRLPRPWNSLGKNTGVGCHFLLQCMKVKSEREVTQLCPTLRDPTDCSLPGSSVHGIFQARVLEWVVAKAFSEPKVKTPLLYFEPQSIRDAYKRKWLRSSRKKGDGENKRASRESASGSAAPKSLSNFYPGVFQMTHSAAFSQTQHPDSVPRQ